jgi:hypothetical protein
MLNITLIWEPFPKESIWCTPSIQLAQLLIELRAHLTIPGQDPAQRFLCLGIQEEADTVQLQSLSGLQLTLSLNSRAGRSTSITLRDALAINFPAVRDIHQLRAVLIGTPLCEVHGTARTDHHRQGALFNLVISEKHVPSKSPNLPTPSRTGVQGEEGTDVPVHNVPDGLPDQEAPPSTARHASWSPSMEPAAPPPQGSPLSWFGATKLLRDRLQELQRRAKQGPLQHGVAMELARLTAGQEAFDKLLPKLKAAQYLDLKDLPRAPRGPSESGRFNFFLPSLKGASPADLALASTWLSHRDTKDWSALNMAGLSTAKTIERWLLPHQVTSSVDHVAELCKVIRRLVQATDTMSAALAWSAEEVRFCRLSESGIIPPYWVQEIRKAMADDDWRQAKVTLAALLEPQTTLYGLTLEKS